MTASSGGKTLPACNKVDMMMVSVLMTAAATTATPPPSVTNIAWANVATTCPAAYKASLAWEDTLARSGGANFARRGKR